MKLTIREQEQLSQPKSEPEVELWLEHTEDNIVLKARLKGAASSWWILVVHPDGSISRTHCVSRDIGFTVDCLGCVKDIT